MGMFVHAEDEAYYVEMIDDLGKDIISLQNRVKYEENKGIIQCMATEDALVRRLIKTIGLELEGIKDIAICLGYDKVNMIMRRVNNIREILEKELADIAFGKKTYIERRDKKNE